MQLHYALLNYIQICHNLKVEDNPCVCLLHITFLQMRSLKKVFLIKTEGETELRFSFHFE